MRVYLFMGHQGVAHRIADKIYFGIIFKTLSNLPIHSLKL